VFYSRRRHKYFGYHTGKKVKKKLNLNLKDYTQNFTPYKSKIKIMNPLNSVLKTPKTKKSREEAEKFREENNPGILQKEYYFTDKILRNKVGDKYAELKGEFLSTILNTGSTIDHV